MMIKHSIKPAVATGALLGLFSLGASAQIAPPTVTYVPVPPPAVVAQAVPAMSSAALIALAMLLGFVGVRLLKDKRARKVMSVAILVAGGACAVVGAMLGANTVQALANGAVGPTVVNLSNPDGTQITLPIGPTPDYQLPNTTSVPLKITAIDPGDCSETPLANAGIATLPPGAVDKGVCAVGTVLKPGDYCTLVFYCSIPV